MRVGTKIKSKHDSAWRLKQQGESDVEVVTATPTAYHKGILAIDQEDGEAVILTWKTIKALNKQRKRDRRREQCQGAGSVPAGCI